MAEDIVEPRLAAAAAAQPEENLKNQAALDLPPTAQLMRSGLYVGVPSSSPERPPPWLLTVPIDPPFSSTSELLRIDVDGWQPLGVASGTLTSFLTGHVHWIANLHTAPSADRWLGTIWFKDGDVARFPYTDVEITFSIVGFRRFARATFNGGGAPSRTRTFRYGSPGFHAVEFEFDVTTDARPVLELDTHAHPNYPASLRRERLNVSQVFTRAGFNVRTSSGSAIIPLAGAGADGVWTDMEMHDAMQMYWSRFSARPQWALWTLIAAMHEVGPSRGGIMFDDLGPQHRQGTAIFTSSFISNPERTEPNPEAWVNRMIFWTTCHEMGHAFNLAHSWDKAAGTPWIPSVSEPEVRSFMNYPFRVIGGEAAFFADFEFRFSDAELLFLRHAPERLVQMGNAAWFDHHGFEQTRVLPEPTFVLSLRVNRARPEFEFMEPVVIELKLTNQSKQPQIVPEKILSMHENMTVIVRREGHEARQYQPYAEYFWKEQNIALAPLEAIYESLFVATGKGGWLISEPGYYTVQIALHLAQEDIVSKPLRLRVAPPKGYDEEYLAQDYFSDEVGRILKFDGSRHLTKGIDTLTEATERLPEHRVAMHSRIALGNALARDFRSLDFVDGEPACLNIQKAAPAAGLKLLSEALVAKPQLAAETLGNIDFHTYGDMYCELLDAYQMDDAAAQVQGTILQTLSARNVKPEVLKSIERQAERYKQA